MPKSCRAGFNKLVYQVQKVPKYKEKGRLMRPFWSPAATNHVRSGEPRSKGGDLLRASQPGAAASVRPSRPENDTLYRFLLRTGLDPSSAKNAARLAGPRPGKRSIRLQKKENTMWCSLSFGIRQLPIFPANASTVRKGRAASPQERLPSAPLLTGLPPRCIPHCGRSAPPHRQPLAVAPRPGKDNIVPLFQKETPCCAGCFLLESGSYLSFRAVASQVLSAYKGLTSVFGMGTGGTP